MLKQPEVPRQKGTPDEQNIAGRQGSMEGLIANTLLIDPAYQREQNTIRVNKIAQEFDTDMMGAVVVSRRTNGDLVLIDGGHRIAALHLMGWGDQEINAIVLDGLTLKDEAHVFSVINSNRAKPKPTQIFRADVIAQQPEAVLIQSVLNALNIEVVDSPKKKGLRSIGTVRTLFRQDGQEALARVLKLLSTAYGRGPNTFNHDLLVSMAAMLRHHPGMSDQRLHDSLRKFGSPESLVADGKRRAIAIQGRTHNAIANVALRAYNMRLREKTRIALFDEDTRITG